MSESESARIGVLLCIAQLHEVGPARLAWCASRDPDRIWADIRGGRPLGVAWSDAELATRWKASASALEPQVELERHRAAGVSVDVLGSPRFPARLLDCPRPPPLLCSQGAAPPADTAMVGIVGTRRASGYGLGVARELGSRLADAGVGVVSGLALGIDAAAQSAALSAGGAVVGVVASGLDRIYPRRNHDLWESLRHSGWLVSEVPLGVEPQRWRFPVRNRIIAALSDVLVVVESNHAGGSMHTVREAEQRGITVMAVPGSIRSATSSGTNQLISEGCPPCCGVDDILVALGLSTSGASPPRAADTSSDRPAESGAAAAVIDALGWERATIDQVAGRSGLAVGEVAETLIGLRLDGRVTESSGLWEQLS